MQYSVAGREKTKNVIRAKKWILGSFNKIQYSSTSGQVVIARTSFMTAFPINYTKQPSENRHALDKSSTQTHITQRSRNEYIKSVDCQKAFASIERWNGVVNLIEEVKH